MESLYLFERLTRLLEENETLEFKRIKGGYMEVKMGNLTYTVGSMMSEVDIMDMIEGFSRDKGKRLF